MVTGQDRGKNAASIPFVALAENMPEPIFVFTKDTLKLLWFNGAAQGWLRKPTESLVGLSGDDQELGLTPLFGLIQACAKSEKTYIGHDTVINIRRHDYICQYRIFIADECVIVLISPRDPTAIVPGGEPAGQDQGHAVPMLGRMLAHELKNPLAGIHGAAQLLEAELQNEDDAELTDLIKTEVNRIGRLVDSIESFGASSPNEPKALNVHAVLRKAKLLFQNRIGDDVEITELYDPSLPEIFGDSDRLMQVFVNLLSNAMDAVNARQNANGGDSQGSGHIQIITRYKVGVRRRTRDGEYYPLPVEIRIVDNGMGIPKNLQSRIFQPFVTSKANGQGLGLALTSKIVSDHGGMIDAVSEPGETAFSILFPIANIAN